MLVYAYMNDIYSSRKIEKACKRDINFMWLLQGRKAPDHATIATRNFHYIPISSSTSMAINLRIQ
ncbi:MAG: transposase [Clostridium sp.]